MARHNAPSIMFLDEADAVLGARGGGSAEGGEHEASRRSKAEFLIQLDGLATCKGRPGDDDESAAAPVLFLASTNLPWSIDPAILRR